MRRFFKALFQVITIFALLTVITPVAYFAWRMDQPLPQPEFKGLTYYQFVKWRKIAYEDRAIEYQKSHPSKKVDTGMCHRNVQFLTVTLLPLQSFGYTVAALNGAKPRASYPLPEDVTLINFVPKWWDTFEHLFWYNTIKLNGLRNDLVEYCRVKSAIPTPEEFDAMNREREIQISATSP